MQQQEHTDRHVPKHASDTAPCVSLPAAIYAPRHELPEPEEQRAPVAPPLRHRVTLDLGHLGGGVRAVAAQFHKLGPGWRVVHDLPIGPDACIDHLVVGPAGVFTVACKHHPDASVWVGRDTVLVDGVRTDYARIARHEAAHAARRLGAAARRSVAVQAVLAVVGAGQRLTIKEQPADGAVHIVAWTAVTTYLAGLPRVLWPHDVETLHDIAGRVETWRPETAAV